jgi:hypothetical protein
MRLTLRTLLAYLDDILEPVQAREIGEKLNESSFASSLVSRIREVMRRRRLTAPTLTGAGMGIDPNTVAEYLDNTLPPDGVADVEKICLESDVHLAEAAACHQILTLALGEPVEILHQTRDRMYALGPSGAKMTIATPSTNGLSHQAVDDVLGQADDVSPARPAVRAVVAPQKHEIPEYLRPRSNFKRVLAFALVAAVIIPWGYWVVTNNPFQNGSAQSKVPDEKQSGENRRANLAAIDARQPSQDDAALVDQSEPDVKASNASDEVVLTDSSGENANPSNRDDSTETSVGIDRSATDEVDEATAPVSKNATALSTQKQRQTDESKDEEPVPVPALDDNPPPIAVAPTPAIYISPDGVALHYVVSDGRWFRLPPRALVHAGDHLAVPDPYQCALEIESGKGHVTILGRSAVQMLAAPRTGQFGLEIKRGQVLVRPAGAGDDPTTPLRIVLGIAGELWKLELRPGTVVGVRVDPLEPKKFEQPPDKNDYLGAFYVAAGGSASITDPGGIVHELKGLDRLDLPLLAATEPGGKSGRIRQVSELPKWIGPPNLSPSDQNYARLFALKFSFKEAVELSIPEVTEDPIPKVSQLATDCLGLIGVCGPLLDILHRSLHPEARNAAISGLRLWLPQNAENKELLKLELAKRFPPDDADAIYRLLWGFDVDDARDKNTSMQLIDWMDNPELAIRELAFYHVHRLTNKDFDYRPGYTAFKNKNPLERWRKHVKKDGGLLPAQKPVPNPQ